jgi:hypothetical protein
MKNTTLTTSHSSPTLRKPASESKSNASSSTSSALNEVASQIQKSCEWLSFLNELHYFPYNSCNSLTIYSYKYWSKQRTFLVSTKENNVKEICFKTRLCREETLAGETERVKCTIGEPALDSSLDDSESLSVNLDPHFKIHKLPKVPSLYSPTFKSIILSLDLFEFFGSLKVKLLFLRSI